jgi:hypothetical protein
MTPGATSRRITSSQVIRGPGWKEALVGNIVIKHHDWFPCHLCGAYFVNGFYGHLKKVHKCADPWEERRKAMMSWKPTSGPEGRA